MSPDMRIVVIVLVAGFLLLQGLAPSALPFTPEAQFSDAAISHWPAALHLRDAVADGMFPLWQDTILGGQPFAANPLNKTAYLPQWLALLVEPAPFLNLMLLGHMLLAGAGMWLFTKTLGLSQYGALLAAVAYALAPRWFAHLGAGHLDLLYALAWWPWLLWSIHRFWMGQGRVIVVAVIAALLFLADVRLSLFAFALALAYGFMLGWHNRRFPLMLALIPTLFVLLTAALTVPLLLWGPYLNRASLTAADAGVYALEPGHFVGLVLAAHGGNHETVTYLGLIVLLLAVMGAASSPRRHLLWLVAVVIAALYALGPNGFLWSLLVQVIPALLWFRVPSRAWFVVVFGVAVLAGYGLDSLAGAVDRLRDDERLRRLVIKRLAAAGLTGSSLICGSLVLLALPDMDAETGLGLLLVGLVAGGLLLLGLYGRVPGQTLAVILILLAFADLAWVGRDWVVWRGPDFWLDHQRPLAEYVQTQIADSGMSSARIYSPNYALEQQVAAAYGLRLFYGVDPFQLGGIVQAIEQGSGVPVDAYSVILPPIPDADDGQDDNPFARANCDAVPDMDTLADWGVLYVVSRCPLSAAGDDGLLAAVEQIGDTTLYWNLALTDDVGAVASGWPDMGNSLPDEAAVTQINSLTLVAYAASAITFAASLLWLWWGKKPHD